MREGVKLSFASIPDSEFTRLLKSHPSVQWGHYRLYKWELLKAINSPDVLLFLLGAEEESAVAERVKELFAGGDAEVTTAKEMFWSKISVDGDAVSDLVRFAITKNNSLVDLIFEDIPLDSFKYYAKFFPESDPQLMERLVNTTEPLPLCDHLKDKEYGRIVAKVREIMDNRKNKKRYDMSCRYLMRSLPRVRRAVGELSDWYFDYFNACVLDPYNRTIPKHVDSDWTAVLEVYNMRRRMAKAALGRPVEAGFAPAIVDEGQRVNLLACRKQDEYKMHRLFSEEEMLALPDPEAIELRPYQEELVESACRGVNTIICAPTGSGKTVVGAYIILEHLRKMSDEGKTARVALMVPTVPLVEQQSTMINKYMRKVYWVEGMSGSEVAPDAGRAPTILASHVAVFTPQIFINLLKSIRKDDRLYITDFTLFIFDECHHCDRDHPYNVLMRMLHDFEGPVPQVVGLTASLPVGTLNVDSALDRMMELCARLSAHSISNVRKHLQSLQQYVTPPVDQVQTTSRSTFDPFVSGLQFCMTRIQMAVKDGLKKAVEDKEILLRQDEMAFPTQQNSTRYESFVGSLKSRLNDLPGGPRKHTLIKLMEHLAFYYRALTMNDLLPDRYAYEYLIDKYKKEKIPAGAGPGSVQHWLIDLFRKHIDVKGLRITQNDTGEKKEIILKLHELLRKQYREEPESRTIIFVTTRVLAEKLAEHLNIACVVESNRRGVGYVTSSNQSAAVSGQSAEEQRSMIERFNSGVVKVLVATAVAEEGLDISACNLIVKYNNTGSERSLIQRRGRARAKNSRSILLALDGAIEQKELENIQKEELMRRCLDHMQTKSEAQMKTLVDAKIREEKVLRDAALLQSNERKRALAGKSFNLNCRLCGAFICKSGDMRIACESQYVCCDPTIWERITAEVHTNVRAFSIATLVGKPRCVGRAGSDCSEVLGTIVKLYGAFLPTISARAISVEDPDDDMHRPQLEKKWDSIAKERFFVEPLGEQDLKVMLTSLYSHSKEKHEKFEAEANLVMQRYLMEIKREKKQRIYLDEE